MVERDRPFNGIPLCAVMKVEFSAYIRDQELSTEMFDAMQLHLETCPRCQDDRVGPLEDFMPGLTIVNDDPFENFDLEKELQAKPWSIFSERYHTMHHRFPCA